MIGKEDGRHYKATIGARLQYGRSACWYISFSLRLVTVQSLLVPYT